MLGFREDLFSAIRVKLYNQVKYQVKKEHKKAAG
jgi:hypothetical protein